MNDIYRSYYTESQPIVQYMMRLLDLQPGNRVLEPCAGNGVFVKALLNQAAAAKIDAVELNPTALQDLQRQFGHMSQVRIIPDNTLLTADLGQYDRIIANPPYGGWLDYDQRKHLQQRYRGLYVKETYALFLYRCLQLLAPDGILVFIVPGTFLNLHRHTRLREFILTHGRIIELALFPSSFFPGVSFGYAKLCIIALQRADNPDGQFEVLTGFETPDDLIADTRCQRYQFDQRDIYNNIDHALFVADDPAITHLINRCELRVGDVADCVTGFYSGADRRFLRTVLNKTGYVQIDTDQVYGERPSLEGLEGPRCFVPIMKGGGVRYLKPDTWFVDWSKEAVMHYRRDRKARFQNADYYFRVGVGVPMVSSKQITAALLEERLFDQSIVGIFPHDERYLHYLLAFFNSPTCNQLIRTINPTANNSANYIKKIPLIVPDDWQSMTTIARTIVESIRDSGCYDQSAETTLHQRIRALYGF